MPFAVPANPKIYHITHVDNLAGILSAGCVWSDRERLDRHLKCSLVGMSRIKQRRLEEIEVDCHTGTKVGEYVPFYFCPRSIMLYILHMGNSPDIGYERARALSVSLLKDWLARYKFKNWLTTKTRGLTVTDQDRTDRAEDIAGKLNDTERWHSHGRGISAQVLSRDLNLEIPSPPNEGFFSAWTWPRWGLRRTSVGRTRNGRPDLAFPVRPVPISPMKQSHPNENAARIVAESTQGKEKPLPASVEAAWAEWSKGIKKVDDRTRMLLRAAFEAGEAAGRARS